MIKRHIQLLQVLLLILLLSGCATIKLIKEKNVNWKNSQFQAILPIGWVTYSSPGSVLSLTRDGKFLQNIAILKSKTGKKLPKTKRKITEDLLIHEVATIIADEMRLAEGISNFEILSKKPSNIGGKDAFRLEYQYRDSNFVKYHGIVYGFIHKKKFYEIEYRAVEQHYHTKSIEIFDNFANSFKIRKK